MPLRETAGTEWSPARKPLSPRESRPLQSLAPLESRPATGSRSGELHLLAQQRPLPRPLEHLLALL
ncbi:MAG: hypothetical protein ACRETB_09105, partial [Steroidobacteraceae bacterium]